MNTQSIISRFVKSPCVFLLLALGLGTGCVLSTARAAEPPAPYGPTPSARQLAWQTDAFHAFIHFTVNTFTGREWGNGDEAEALFNPTALDADQIARTVKEAGMKGLVLTAKHHDGFCLWPSKFTEHSVRNSPWKNGKGDVVREFADACKRQGIKFGVYLSPWDRNRADYGKPEYVTYYKNQLRELLSNYGPIFEVWFDGANGGDGYYGGAREKRKVNANSYYDLPGIDRIIRELQPNAIIQRDFGPDGRWGGNENGEAGDPCWATLKNEHLVFPTTYGSPRNLHGERPGEIWMPSECPISILASGWFYRPDNKPRPFDKLRTIYLHTIGRGANLLLNLAPDKRGQLDDDTIASLRQFKKWHDLTFGNDLATRARASADNTRGGDERFSAAKATDGDLTTYWCSDDGVTTPSLTLDFGNPVTFNLIRLREFLPLGQRVDAFALDAWSGGQWAEFAHATSIGSCRLIPVKTITSAKIRLRITQAAACPAISELGVFKEPSLPVK